MGNIDIVVECADALSVRADVLALKYADALHGVDRAVANALSTEYHGIHKQLPNPSEFFATATGNSIAASNVLFVGVGPLREFKYGEIRSFARRALEFIARNMPSATHVALTVHGPNYGLDEAEAFKSEIAGLLDAINSGSFPPGLVKLTIVERDAGRAKRFTKLLEDILPVGSSNFGVRAERPLAGIPDRLRSVGYDSMNKPHVFVAMPFSEEMDDIFHYGIQGAVTAAGFLCERADLSSFTGDVLDWIKRRIASASLVVADLSGANPNVYLEVGFAWGCGRPTILIVNNTLELKFDVRGQRCISYNKIRDLEVALREELRKIKSEVPV